MKNISRNSIASVRAYILGCALILAMFYSIGIGLYYSWGMVYRPIPSDADYISIWESRFANLKKEIPADEKSVGYVSNWDMVGYDKDVYIEFVLTQYTLAPILVERNLDHEWIIANSSSSSFMDWLSKQMTTPYTTKYFGNGIYLVHRAGIK
jgi:hypothetical protein